MLLGMRLLLSRVTYPETPCPSQTGLTRSLL